MKSSLVRKVGYVFVSTATGFCLLSAVPGLSQETAPALPLEPPRPAIRDTAPDLPIQVIASPDLPTQVVAERPAPPPIITPGTPKKLPPLARPSGISAPVISARKNPVPLQIVPRTGTGSSAPGLIITPGPSTNPALGNKVQAPAAVETQTMRVAPEVKLDEELFEMPALSVPTGDKDTLNAAQALEPRLLEAPAPSEPTLPLPQGPSFGLSVHVIGLEGCCPVTLRDGRMQVPGLDEYTSEYEGIVYRFATPQAKQRFEARPEHYAPAQGGRDVLRTAQEGEDVPGSLDHAIWYRRQLYLFQNETTLKTFTANPEQYLAK